MRWGWTRKRLEACIAVVCALGFLNCHRWPNKPKRYPRNARLSAEAGAPRLWEPGGAAPGGVEVLLREEYLHRPLDEGADVRVGDALPARPSLTVSLRLMLPLEGAVEARFVPAGTDAGSPVEPAVRVRVTGGPDPRLEAYVADGWIALPGGIEREPGGLVRATFVLRAGGSLETSLPPGAPFTVPLAGGLPFPLGVVLRGNEGGTVEGIEVTSP